MATIQDIQAFAERIYDIVQDYVDGNYNADDVLAIGKRCGKITMKADAKEAIKVGKSSELYPLKVCTLWKMFGSDCFIKSS